MVEIILDTKEPIDSALKALKHKLDIEGTMDEIKSHKNFETPKQKRKRKEHNRAKREKQLEYYGENINFL